MDHTEYTTKKRQLVEEIVNIFFNSFAVPEQSSTERENNLKKGVEMSEKIIKLQKQVLELTGAVKKYQDTIDSLVESNSEFRRQVAANQIITKNFLAIIGGLHPNINSLFEKFILSTVKHLDAEDNSDNELKNQLTEILALLSKNTNTHKIRFN